LPGLIEKLQKKSGYKAGLSWSEHKNPSQLLS
jgi:hypothetical protein